MIIFLFDGDQELFSVVRIEGNLRKKGMQNLFGKGFRSGLIYRSLALNSDCAGKNCGRSCETCLRIKMDSRWRGSKLSCPASSFFSRVAMSWSSVLHPQARVFGGGWPGRASQQRNLCPVAFQNPHPGRVRLSRSWRISLPGGSRFRCTARHCRHLQKQLL